MSIGLHYRPPSFAPPFADLEDFLGSVSPSKLKTAVLLGDFNTDLLSQTPQSQDILSTLLAFHLHQVVNEPTRITSSSSTLIYHVYVSDPSLVNTCSTAPAIGNSDHFSIITTLNKRAPPPQRIQCKVWSYRAADWDKANGLLASTLPIEIQAESDVDAIWSSWKSKFLDVMASCIPSRVVSIRKSVPWLNADCIRVIRKRDHLSANKKHQLRLLP